MKYYNIFTSKKDVTDIRKAAGISRNILAKLRDAVQIGNTPVEIDKLADSLCKEYNVLPAFRGVKGPKNNFPAACNVNVNDEALHAIPYSTFPFESGDLVTVDFGIIYNGFFTDHAITVGLGDLTSEEQRLIETAKLCVDTAIKQAVKGNHVGDISHALQSVADMAGFDYIRGYSGHGIGKDIHEAPSVPYHGKKGDGPELKEGMLLCIENQLSLGTGQLILDGDGWTLRTKDGSKTAMFEHMVMIKKGRPEVLTRLAE
jgi:methionyl aminopeptidase